MGTIFNRDCWDIAEVEFRSTISESEYCICDACHKTGEVMKLTLPETAYHRNGQLSTKYREYWLCSECEEKLMSVLTPLGMEKTSQIDKQEELHCWYCIGIESHGIATVKTVTDEYGHELGAYDTPYNFCPNCGRKIKED